MRAKRLFPEKVGIVALERIGMPLANVLRRNGTMVVLGGIRITAFMIRIAGTAFGLPYTHHRDEMATVQKALTMPQTGDYNPHFFDYPTLYI